MYFLNPAVHAVRDADPADDFRQLRGAGRLYAVPQRRLKQHQLNPGEYHQRPAIPQRRLKQHQLNPGECYAAAALYYLLHADANSNNSVLVSTYDAILVSTYDSTNRRTPTATPATPTGSW